MLASNLDGLHCLLVEDFDTLPVDLVVGLGLVFPDCRCCLLLMFTQSLLQRPGCLPYVMLPIAVASNVLHHAQLLLTSFGCNKMDLREL